MLDNCVIIRIYLTDSAVKIDGKFHICKFGCSLNGVASTLNSEGWICQKIWLVESTTEGVTQLGHKSVLSSIQLQRFACSICIGVVVQTHLIFSLVDCNPEIIKVQACPSLTFCFARHLRGISRECYREAAFRIRGVRSPNNTLGT